MARPRAFDIDEVLDQVMAQFWEAGFEATSIHDLEARTGLSRSSLYQTWGSKRGLFDAALDRYLDVRIGSMLAGLETGQGGLEAVIDFFAGIARHSAAFPSQTALGCLMVNSTTELALADPSLATKAGAYRDRLRAAFTQGLESAADRGELPSSTVADRARLLTTATLGLFVYLRGNTDVDDSVRAADAIADSVRTWGVLSSA